MQKQCNVSYILQLTCINVCGIKSKSLCPEFHELITLYAIFICIESKLDDLDVLTLPLGYSYFSKTRKQFEENSGGIVFIYQTSLKPFITILPDDSDYVLWVNICNFSECPKYTSPEAFDDIENKLQILNDNERHSLCLSWGF